MSLLVVGVSHRTAPVTVLERVAVAGPDTAKMLDALLTGEHVNEAMLVSTCNRVEIYAVVETFHGGLTEVSQVLAGHAHAEVSDLTDHLYVHYAGSAVEHLFSVAAGLDSLVIGEQQILGQLRAAYAEAHELGTAGRTLHEIAQQALRVGKRAHAETGIDDAGASVVSEALQDAADALGRGRLGSSGLGSSGLGSNGLGSNGLGSNGLGSNGAASSLAGRRALIVGAGAMGGLSTAHLRRLGVDDLVLANRSPENAERLVDGLRAEGARARAVGLDALAGELAGVDVVVACTGAVGTVVSHDAMRAAVAAREAISSPLVVCDLGLPRDVDPRVAGLAGVVLVDLETLGDRLRTAAAGQAVEDTRAVVAEEVRTYLAGQRSAAVTPTVTALRRRAAEVVDAELLRLDGRLPGIDDRVRDELAHSVRRVVDKLLHTPTVQVKRLAQSPGGDTYAEALRELFELDPQAPVALASPGTETGVSVGPADVDSALAVDYRGVSDVTDVTGRITDGVTEYAPEADR